MRLDGTKLLWKGLVNKAEECAGVDYQAPIYVRKPDAYYQRVTSEIGKTTSQAFWHFQWIL